MASAAASGKPGKPCAAPTLATALKTRAKRQRGKTSSEGRNSGKTAQKKKKEKKKRAKEARKPTAQQKAASKQRAQRRLWTRSQPTKDYLVKDPKRPTFAEAATLGEARVLASAAPKQDPVLKVYLFCSPSQDEDSTTKAVRREQARLLHDLPTLWLHTRAWRCFGTERFVDELGASTFASLADYERHCVEAAFKVWDEGYHAVTNAYGRPARDEWCKEKEHWSLAKKDEAKSKQLHRAWLEGYWQPKAQDAWARTEQVKTAVQARDWEKLNQACVCKGAGTFGALQLAKELASTSPAKLETWYPVLECPGTVRGLEWLYGRKLKDEEALSKLCQTRDKFRSYCKHKRFRSYCKHKRFRSYCKHKRFRSYCKHKRFRSYCSKHKRFRSYCKHK